MFLTDGNFDVKPGLLNMNKCSIILKVKNEEFERK